jgi:hypothetical protein
MPDPGQSNPVISKINQKWGLPASSLWPNRDDQTPGYLKKEVLARKEVLIKCSEEEER